MFDEAFFQSWGGGDQLGDLSVSVCSSKSLQTIAFLGLFGTPDFQIWTKSHMRGGGLGISLNVCPWTHTYMHVKIVHVIMIAIFLVYIILYLHWVPSTMSGLLWIYIILQKVRIY